MKIFRISARLTPSVLAAALAASIAAAATARTGWAQEAAAAAQGDGNPAPAKISDEPRAVDPATLLPEVVTKRQTVTFQEQSLADVVRWLREDAKLTVIVDQRSLTDAGILPSEPVDDRLENEPLYLLLDRLRSLSLRWHLEDEVLHLAAGSDEEHVFTRQYNVGDLFDRGHTADDLLETVVATIMIDSWEEVGGAASIVALGDVLFVRQSHRGHRRVAGLLQALRKPGRRTLINDPPANQQIRQALRRPVDVAHRQTPLMAVAEQLASDAGIDLRLDVAALRASGVRQRTPIDVEVSGQPLTVTLDLLASQYDLAWRLQDGVLWITTPEVAETGRTAVFDVRDLCRNRDESDGLLDAITSQAAPASWQDVGGAGVISFPVPGTMVVHQPERLLDAVLQLLENYRSALRTSKPRIRPESDPQAVITRYYRLPAEVATDLEAALPQLLSPETWRSESRPDAAGVVRRLASRVELQLDAKTQQVVATIPHSVLVITQRREVHDRLPALLQRVQNGDATQFGGMGGMGGGFGGGFFSVPSTMPRGR